MELPRTGEVITFYSYKGGTGRSMVLANIAALLTHAGKRVLVIDWDLEAPGLHRYFADRIQVSSPAKIDQAPGLVDLIWRLCDRLAVLPGFTVEQARACSQRVDAFDELASAVQFDSLPLIVDCGPGATGLLHFIKAGSFGSEYSKQVNTVPWEPLFYRAPGLFDSLARYLTARYDYVLIDSRTGLTDTSGICTMLMPHKLVLVFTPNRQSLDGVLDLAQQALNYRATVSDMRPLVVFPLASRIDDSETNLRTTWRRDAETGYQPRFEKLMTRMYGLDECSLELYFDVAQIPHAARFSYGERIAVLEERIGDTLSFAAKYPPFYDRLVAESFPWEDPAAVDAGQSSSIILDRLVQQLPHEESAVLRHFLTRLVRPAGNQEGGDSLLVYPVDDLPTVARPLIPRLQRAGIVSVAAVDGRPESVTLTNESLLREPNKLREWIDQDREFLLWRDSLRKPLYEFRRNPTSISSLDTALVETSIAWLNTRSADLTASEIEFLMEAIGDCVRRSALVLCSLAASELQRSATAESATRSAQLAAESLRRLHTVEGDQIVRDALAMLPPRLAKLDNPEPIAFLGTRTDRSFIACSTGSQVRFWEDPERDPTPVSFTFNRPVFALSASSDGSRIATCDCDGLISVIRERAAPVPLTTVARGQTFLEFDYQDRLVAIQSTGGLFLVDTATGSQTSVCSIQGPVAFSRSSIDRKLFCAASQNETACWVWRADDSGPARRIETDRPCSAAAFSTDDRQIAIAMPGDDGETVITVFDLDSFTPVITHRITDRLDRLIFSPGDLGVVVVTGGRTAQILPVRIKIAGWRTRIDSDVCAAAASAHAGILAFGGADGIARIVDFSSGRETMRLDHGAPLRIVRFNSNGEHLVTAGEDQSVCVWDVRGRREAMRIDHADRVWDVQFHPSGAHLLTVGNDVVQAVEVPSGKLLQRFPQFGKSGSSAAFSPDGSKLCVTLTNGQVDVLSWPAGQNLARYFHKKMATCCAFSPNGAWLATGGTDGRILLVAQQQAAEPREFQHHDAVWDVRFHPDSQRLLSGDDRGLRVWELAPEFQGQVLFPAPCHACLYSPDGEWIVAACDDGICRILTAEGEASHSVRNGSRINCVAMAPDGQHIAIGGDDSLKVWSLLTDREIVHIRYDGEVQWLSFSPDGRYLAVASSDNTARLWLWRSADLIDLVRARTPQTAVAGDWTRLVPADLPRMAQLEPDLQNIVTATERARLVSIRNKDSEQVMLTERVWDELGRLMAFGLIVNRNRLGSREVAFNNPIRIDSLFELSPRGRAFLR